MARKYETLALVFCSTNAHGKSKIKIKQEGTQVSVKNATKWGKKNLDDLAIAQAYSSKAN